MWTLLLHFREICEPKNVLQISFGYFMIYDLCELILNLQRWSVSQGFVNRRPVNTYLVGTIPVHVDFVCNDIENLWPPFQEVLGELHILHPDRQTDWG